MQLLLIFHKTLIKANWKPEYFSHKLNSFSVINKTVTGKEGGGGKFIIFDCTYKFPI